MTSPFSLPNAKEDDWWLEQLWARYCGSLSGNDSSRISSSAGGGGVGCESSRSSSATTSIARGEERGSGTPVGISSSLSFSLLHPRSPPVLVLWETWSPVLLQLPFYASAEASVVLGEGRRGVAVVVEEMETREGGEDKEHKRVPIANTDVTAMLPPSPPPETFTHYFFLPIYSCASSRRSPPSSSSVSSLWCTDEMMYAIRKQPDLMLPLITFFYAWMLYKKVDQVDDEEEIKESTREEGEEQRGRPRQAPEAWVKETTSPSSSLSYAAAEVKQVEDGGGKRRSEAMRASRMDLPSSSPADAPFPPIKKRRNENGEGGGEEGSLSTASLHRLLRQQHQHFARHCRRVACEGRLYGVLVPLPAMTRLPASSHPSSSSPLLTSFSHVGAIQLGQLVMLTGSVIRLSPSRVMCKKLIFSCQHCGARKWVETEDGVLTYPGSCDGLGDLGLPTPTLLLAHGRGKGSAASHGSPQSLARRRGSCRGYRWTPLTQTAICEEVQLLKLQEAVGDVEEDDEDDDGEGEYNGEGSGKYGLDWKSGARHRRDGSSGGGRVNKVLEVLLRVPFLNVVAVGDVVLVCGVLRTRKESSGGGWGKQKATPGLQLCLHAVSIAPYVKENEWGGSRRSSNSSTLGAIPSARESPQLERFIGVLLQSSTTWKQTPHSRYQEAMAMAGSTGNGTTDPTTGEGTPGYPTPAALRSFSSLNDLTGSGFSMAERAQFFEAVRHPLWFRRLAASVGPGLFGLTMVKEALLLALLGGSDPRVLSPSSSSSSFGVSSTTSGSPGMRRSIHVLLLGDPGMGKSQLLRAACALASRSVYVCAHTSSSCGLTLTLSRDPISGEATFEAGAVVHGDGGVTAIDEIDKGGGAEHKALLEVMEQETVSVAKAGVLFSLPVQTSIFAAGNPVGGSFHASLYTPFHGPPALTDVCRLSPALLSRFDIVLLLRDLPGQPCGEWPVWKTPLLQDTHCSPHPIGDPLSSTSFLTSPLSFRRDAKREREGIEASESRDTSWRGVHRSVAPCREDGKEEVAVPYRPWEGAMRGGGRTGATAASPTSTFMRSTALTQHVLGFHRLSRRPPLGEEGENQPTRTCAAAATRAASAAGDVISPLPTALAQRFIAYARATCHPRLSPDAAHILKAHYLEARAGMDCLWSGPYASAGSPPPVAGNMGSGWGGERRITPRYLQSLIRLSSARAKAELRSEVTTEDATYAVALFQGCLSTIASPSSAASHPTATVAGSMEGGGGGDGTRGSGMGHPYSMDVDPSWRKEMSSVQRGRGGKKKKMRDQVVELLRARVWQQRSRPSGGGEDEASGSSFSAKFSRRELMEVCEEAGCPDFLSMLRELNEVGILLQAGDGYVFRGG